MIAFICLMDASAQFIPIPGFRGGRAAMVAEDADPAKPNNDKQSEDRFPGGPTLKTDPEAQQLLARAEQFVADGRHDLSAVLWQKVLDDAGDNLVSVDGRLYISLRRQVEERLSELPEIALRTYRITADGDARALLSTAANSNAPGKEEAALSEVVRRYFLSSWGDDAAYKLGCLALDRHDFVVAHRMFSKVMEEHPDPSIPEAEILLRMAISAGRIGDREGAEKALTEIAAASGSRPSRTLLSRIETDIAQYTSPGQSRSHVATAPTIPAEVTAKTLSEEWSTEYPLYFREQAMNIQAMYNGQPPSAEKTLVARGQLVEEWKKNGWVSAGKVLFHDDRVFFKTNKDLTCWNLRNLSEREIWKTLWDNEFEIDDYSILLAMYNMSRGMMAGGSSNNEVQPRTASEIFLFGDRIQQDMSIAGDTIYSIEGRRIAKSAAPDPEPRAPRQFQWNTPPRRSRSNWLSAYDARTGKIKWNRNPEDEVKVEAKPETKAETKAEAKADRVSGFGFMAAPTLCGSILLAPVTDGGTLWLYGLAPESGRTLWKTYLCDEPVTNGHPWSPIGVTVEGREAYVLTGTGVIFSIDGTSGAIRWVVRYERPQGAGNINPRMAMNGMAMLPRKFEGFTEEKLIVSGRLLVVMASDSEDIFAIDRRTGDIAWKSPRNNLGTDITYCLGVQGDGLYLAGPTAVRCLHIVHGKISWYKEFERSYGRGVLTSDAIYMPVKDSVLKLDVANKGKEISQVGVRMTSNDPVGNLYTDGEKLWMLSGNRLSVLTHLEARMAQLDKRILQGDISAQWDRLRLLVKMGEWERVKQDLFAAQSMLKKTKTADAAGGELLGMIDELRLAREKPSLMMEWLPQLFPAGPGELQGTNLIALQQCLNVCLETLPREKTAGFAAKVLALAPLLNTPIQLDKASRCLKRVSTPEDKDLFRTALNQGGAAAFVVAESLALLDPAAAQEALRPLLKTPDLNLRLQYTRGLLQAGDTSILPSLLEMMASPDQEIRSRSWRTIRNVTGQNIEFIPYANDDIRSKQTQAWKEWITAQGDKLALKLPLADSDLLLGRTLIVSRVNNGTITELDSNRKQISEHRIQQARAVLGLKNGNRLVSRSDELRVVEYNEKWAEVWSVDGFPGEVIWLDRTLDGNTIAVCPDASQIIEITPKKDKKVIWQADARSRPTFAKRLDNGNTLICLQRIDKVVEIAPDGKTVLEINNVKNPMSAQRLENGGTLVASYGTGIYGRATNSGTSFITEYDSTGTKVATVKENMNRLINAMRLPDGKLMYADAEGVQEIEADGKSVWKLTKPNVISFSHF